MDLTIQLDEKSPRPLHRQLSDAVRDAIIAGRLAPGQQLPSTREFCEQLNISRFTVRRSYEDLIAQGYVESTRGGGNFVSSGLCRGPASPAESKPPGGRAIQLSAYGRRVLANADLQRAELFSELNYGIPTIEHLPVAAWRQFVHKHCRFDDASLLNYLGEPFGYPPLRQAIAQYLGRARAIACQSEQVAIFSGSQPALDLLCRIVLEPGDAAAMENPGYPGARRTFITHGANLIPIPVDGDGLVVDELKPHAHKVKILYVTPSHQDPTGVVLSLPRRLELLDLAKRSGMLIVEDDNDSEFRYGSRPIPALKGLDPSANIVYLSTFWKTLGPMVIMGFAVLPDSLREALYAAKSMIERDFPLLEQSALADFINAGHFERHIKRTRAEYAKRRQALVYSLSLGFRQEVQISPETAGMHLVVHFKNIQAGAVLAAAASAKLSLVSTASYYVGNAGEGFLIPFAHLSAEELGARVKKFARILSDQA